ncbi:hypothetical protein K3495_g16961, partial [Podosphaera aphanis]
EWKAELVSVAKPFTILSDHKNLNYFTSKRLLSERQVRYNDVLQQFKFILKWRPGDACDRPDALSRRDQDKPVGLEDERTSGRVMSLLPAVPLNPANVTPPTDNNEAHNCPNDAAGSSIVNVEIQTRIFDDVELQNLWDQGVAADRDWCRAREAVKKAERSFPPDLALRYSVNIAECSVRADGVLRGRADRIWVPDYEPLRTAI